MATPAFAGEWFSWDKKNTELHYYVTGLIFVDLGQTLYIADNPQEFNEKYNLYLDEYPSRNEVKEYFAWSYILTIGVIYVLPDEWSIIFQKGIIGLEAYVVGRNAYIGIGIDL